MHQAIQAAAALLLTVCVLPGAWATCGAAFCTVNTNWDVHGAWGEPGLRVDLRYEYVNQDQPRAGSDKVSVGQVPRHHDEVYTKNRNWLASADYTFNADWGVTAALPVVDRAHNHLHNHRGAQLPESWDFTSAGDLRVLGRYRLAAFEGKAPSLANAGVNFGLKLPTGRHDVRNGDGELAERTLQPGTGTTDALLGAYFAQLFPASDLSWFVQALVQQPLNSRDQYRPGTRVGLDAGLRYDPNEHVGLLLQINALYRGRDSGTNAEPHDSGGNSLWLSPGVNFGITSDIRAYVFVQLPLYQYVNGVQLTADRGWVAGLSARF
jgi:hypothetical protein